MNTIIWILLGAAFVWYWADTTKAREIAIVHGRRACKEMNLQFLDGTVVRYSTRFKRGQNGQVHLARDFNFEFTSNGIQRYPGHIRLLGRYLQVMDLQYTCPEEQQTSNLIMFAEYSEDTLPGDNNPSNTVDLTNCRGSIDTPTFRSREND
ncbi:MULTISPECIES: DUF3301 domain-containing protein [unclassified Endozoicomonas]|uniref:DUF3301 domain-containing protein n=1 Tax=unclassified Endozoicomonas TaxID=2644528 RepID=UPI002148041D|nr:MULTISPECIES: DUF3301 domain-containing protein [unclassified Endozoicomonas]